MTIDQVTDILSTEGYFVTKNDDDDLLVRVTKNSDEPPVKVVLYTDSEGFEYLVADGIGYSIDDPSQAVRNAHADRYERKTIRQYNKTNRKVIDHDHDH